MNKQNWVIVAIVLVLGFFVFKRLTAQTDIEQIESALNQIATQATFEKPVDKLEVLNRTEKIKSHFIDKVEVFYTNLDKKVISQFESIKAYSLSGHKYAVQLKSSWQDLNTDISNNSASVSFHFTVEGKSRENDKFIIKYFAEATLVKVEDQWKFNNIDVSRLEN